MEVHAHSHTERKKWYHYIWEFLMLFLAVTLGFLVENLREHSIEHQRLIRFTKQLVRGFGSDTVKQNEVINLLSKKERSFDSLRYFLAMPKDDSIKWMGIYRNMWGLENAYRYSYNRSAHDQISNSGSLRLFTNDLIVDSLTLYETNEISSTMRRNAEIDYIVGIITPFLNTHFDKNLIVQRFGTYIEKPDWDISKHGHTLPPYFLDHVAEWKLVFENIVITAREINILLFLNLRKQRDFTGRLINLLKKEYHLSANRRTPLEK